MVYFSIYHSRVPKLLYNNQEMFIYAHTCQVSLFKSVSHYFQGQIWPDFPKKAKAHYFSLLSLLKSAMRYPVC